jgi:transposase InsO family protein
MSRATKTVHYGWKYECFQQGVTVMEAVYYAARGKLRYVLTLHPEWTQAELAAACGMSVGWVKKWKQRVQAAHPQDETVLHSRSRARLHPPERLDERVVECVLTIRDQPPEGLRRTPGPKAILYYLPRDQELAAASLRLPKSTRTIWRLLRQHGRILPRCPRHREPLERPAPLLAWQLDFKDASSVPADPQGKRQHVVEVLDVVDMGTSLLLEALPRTDFTAETALESLAAAFKRLGLPSSLTLDRDTRWVGAAQGSDFPSALLRFCLCLGIQVRVCPPHRPDLNAFVERYHRTYQAECLQVERPHTLQEVVQVTDAFQQHYNHERPNQALSCGNRPPRTAFPMLPTLPSVPEQVDPDRWLQALDGWQVVRTVSARGLVSVDLHPYYISRALAGQAVALRLDAAEQALLVLRHEQPLKVLPLKGLHHRLSSFDDYVQRMTAEARAQQRLLSWQQRRRRLASADSP